MARAGEVLRLLGAEADVRQRVRDQVWTGNACTGGSRCDRFCSFPAQIPPGLSGANWVPLPPASRHRARALCCGLLVGDGLSRRLLGRDHDVFRVDRSDGLQGLRPWDRGLHVTQRVDELHVHRGSVRRVCQRFSQVLYRLSVRGDPLADVPGDCPRLAPQLSPGHALCSLHVLLRAAHGGSSRQAHRGHVEGLHYTGRGHRQQGAGGLAGVLLPVSGGDQQFSAICGHFSKGGPDHVGCHRSRQIGEHRAGGVHRRGWLDPVRLLDD
mmetsp:Transcript_7811/g.18758  ORF Transcript_7811/g.18758 Transcript_7811/m.18758 type:complete len:268 (+) Transcript_7811:422-1225(+)